MADERQPLLRHSTEEARLTASQVPAHEVTTSAQEYPDYPIDHGRVAWMQVLGGFILFANSWGLPNAFGVFQTYYVDTLMPDQDASSIAWIGSIQLFFTTIGCLPAGVLLDRGYLKSIIAVGTVLEVAGLVLTSLSKGFWPILFAQGVCMGVGSGLMALIPVAVLAMFFEKKRMLATGLASTGASVAGIIYTLSMRSLFISVGFSWAVRIFALIVLATNAIAFTVMKLQFQYGSKGSKFSLHHFKDLPYSVFVVAFTLFVASSFVPFFFIQEYALQLGVSKDMAFNLLSIMNAANIFGRFVPNYIADRYGGVNTLLPLSIACIITLCLLPLAQTVSSLIAISIVYGFLSGGVIIIPGPTITDLSPSKAEMGVRLGLAYLVASFGGLLGNPLMGAIKGDGKNAVSNFSGLWFCAAAVMGAGVFALIATRWLKLGSPLAVGRV
ncbi:MFS general substrate transporter [Cucurbitaria berberidis CBS 394.84]|uniref:MFS general substrate transporter n=1 Tax=Cucurbitaria berberidis CBS 394.84 TaxID=1168544 RepID=A0A9P4GN61_9PLEO|nr:MFS general substrate transporter [Cucurbitaria berberidis CBS 394.84]KAF1848111.1 MFS general substrate transporter [Cucurbitaria berberidis CBS 394.84]